MLLGLKITNALRQKLFCLEDLPMIDVTLLIVAIEAYFDVLGQILFD